MFVKNGLGFVRSCATRKSTKTLSPGFKDSPVFIGCVGDLYATSDSLACMALTAEFLRVSFRVRQVNIYKKKKNVGGVVFIGMRTNSRKSLPASRHTLINELHNSFSWGIHFTLWLPLDNNEKVN